MNDTYSIFKAACKLGDVGLADLRRLLEQEAQARRARTVQAAEARGPVHGYKDLGDGWTYCLQAVKCGKAGCKCSAGDLHGPYWYGYRRLEGKLVSKYVGKEFRPIDTADGFDDE